MSDHAAENLRRLMAEHGLSVRQLAEKAGLDERTIRGILSRANTPRARTLHQLARGLGVAVDELFLDPAQLLYRRFDRLTNPAVEEVLQSHPALFSRWSEADFDELHSRVGKGGALTVEGTLAAVTQMNRRRDLHEKLDLLLESSHAETIRGIMEVLYDQVVLRGPR
jgi:transcriptional regulator with XRE-family HTH domain